MAEPTRRALLIGTARYQDAALPDLAGATTDTTTLAEVLRDERIGGFTVSTVLDRPAHEVAREIEDMLGACSPRDLVLLYFTGHGIKGPDGRLYFAAANTDAHRLRSSAIAAAWIHDVLDACRSRRQMVLLDCCHSGAFTQGTKAGEQVGSTEQLQGRGRVILTASDAIQFALEHSAGDQLVRSVFTTCVARGLRTGDADVDGDGLVTLDDLFEYVQDAVQQENPLQTPQMTAISLQGEFVVARNPYADHRAPISSDLAQAAASPLAGVRLGAVEELRRLLATPDDGIRRAAMDLLTTLADDDSRRVSSAAASALALTSTTTTISPTTDGRSDGAGSDVLVRSDEDVAGHGGAPQRSPPGVPTSRRRSLALAGGLLLLVSLAAAFALWRQGEVPEDASEAVAAQIDQLDWQAATIDATDVTGAELTDVAWTGEEFIAVGSRDAGGQDTAILLRSPDAATWEAPYRAALHGDGPRELYAVAAGGGVVVVAGVDGARPGTDAAVWWIRNGEITRATSEDLAGEGYQEIRDVVWDGQEFLAVGCVDQVPADGSQRVCEQNTTGTQRPAVWRSSDGRDWTRVPVDLPAPAAMYAVERTETGFVAIGHEQPQGGESRVAAFWRSTDGRDWTKVEDVDPGVQPVQSVLGLAVGDAAAVAVGYQGDDTRLQSRDMAVWSTSDGVRWRRVLHPEVDDRQLLFDVVALDEGFLAVASMGSGDDDGDEGAVWTSSDGERWERQETTMFRGGVQLTAITASSDRVVVTGRRAPRDAVGTIAWAAPLR